MALEAVIRKRGGGGREDERWRWWLGRHLHATRCSDMLASTEQYYPRAYARVSDFEGSMLELYASACICD